MKKIYVWIAVCLAIILLACFLGWAYVFIKQLNTHQKMVGDAPSYLANETKYEVFGECGNPWEVNLYQRGDTEFRIQCFCFWKRLSDNRKSIWFADMMPTFSSEICYGNSSDCDKTETSKKLIDNCKHVCPGTCQAILEHLYKNYDFSDDSVWADD